MKLGIKNATLISMDETRKQVEEQIDIYVEDGQIKNIGKNLKELDENIKIIDAKKKVVMPGLINTHAHIPMSIFRETLDGYNLQEWLNDKIWPMEDKLQEQDIYYASYLSFIEMIKTGCTTINDMYFMTDEIIKAMEETGIRLQTTRTLQDIDGVEAGEKRLQELQRLIDKYKNKNSKLTFNVGIHGLYTSSLQYVQKCIEFAKKNNLHIHMHFCENQKEVEDIKNNYNREPMQVLLQEFKNVKTILAHCVKLENEDIENLKSMDISVAHCPVSNLKLGCGIAKISKMIEDGINVSIGTDGQGSGSNLDLFEAMKYTALLQKGVTENPKLLPAYEVLKMATINGAKTLGLEDKVGSIEIGKRADIIILDLDTVLTKPVNNIISEIVYNVKGSNVCTTIVDGNILMEDRKLTKNIENDVALKCDNIIKKISN